MNAPLMKVPRPGTRKAEVLAFLEEYWFRTGGGAPKMSEIAERFGFGETRAKQLIHALAVDRMIERQAGRHQAIRLPHLIRRLEAAGFTVNPDGEALATLPCPKGQLPRLPRVRHIPDDFDAGIDDGNSSSAGREAAGGHVAGNVEGDYRRRQGKRCA